MDKKDDKRDIKEIVVGVLISLVPLGFGVWMIAAPKLMNGAHPHGRHLLMKKLLAWIWGYPAGIILAIVGLMMLWGAFLPDTPDDDEDED